MSRRLTLSEMNRYPALSASLERFRERAGRWELPLALTEARADCAGRMSVNRQGRGDVLRFAYRCRARRIHSPREPVAERPVASFADRVYANIAISYCEEAARSGEPVLIRNRGAVRRPDGHRAVIDVVVLSAAYRSRAGSLISTSHFSPASAA